MKIIDLLNKIARGEDVPKKIKYDNKIWYWNVQTKEYISTCTICVYRLIPELGHINDEVEIIEEKKIPEKIDLTGYWDKNSLRTEEWCSSEEFIGVKINEILDYLESKEKGE